MKLFLGLHQPMEVRQGLHMNFSDLEAITELVASLFLALYLRMTHPVLTDWNVGYSLSTAP